MGQVRYRPASLSAAAAHGGTDYGLAGVIAPMAFGMGASNPNLVANRAYFARFVPSFTFSATKIAFGVQTAASTNDACDVGIYDSTVTKIVTAGATTGKLNATGLQTVTIAATTLTAGTVYYAAVSCGTLGGTAAQLAMTSHGVANTGDFFGTTAGTQLCGFAATSHPLPVGPVALSTASAVAYLAVRVS